MRKKLIITILCLLLIFCVMIISCTTRSGKHPQEERLRRVQESPNYRDGEFQNQIPTPLFTEDVSTISIIWSNITDKNERLVPSEPIETIKTDLKSLDLQLDFVVWLGHSSWFIQLGGKRILIDPVLSDYAAPFPFANKAFDGTSIYSPDDIPEIDILLISHDHWDHLDYDTVTALRSKIKRVICPLGVGSHFEYWDFPKEKIHEVDWNGRIAVETDFTVHVLPARHYSGRFMSKNKTQWAGFALVTPARKIFFSGDSGYGPHFSRIGEAFQGFDLVLLDAGQYDSRWALIHMTPEEAARAAEDLGAKLLVPAHIGRFAIANHAWDEPFFRLVKASENKSYRLLTPLIGESVSLGNDFDSFSYWWEKNSKPSGNQVTHDNNSP